MKYKKQWGTIILTFILICYAPGALAMPLNEAIKGNDGEWLTSVQTAAGSGHFQYEDGPAEQSAFRMPGSLLMLSDGSILISDTKNQLIRKVHDGKVTTFAGFSALPVNAMNLPIGALVDGTYEKAVFHEPGGLAVDSKGNIYVADSANHAIRKLTPDGNVITLAGDGVLGNRDGKGEEARFYQPLDLAVAADGTLYVADTLNHLIRKISPEGVVTTLNAASGRTVEIIDGVVVPAGDYADGPISKAKFNEPSGLALDAKGNLYVSDSGNHLIRYIDFKAGTVTTAAGSIGDIKKPYKDGAIYAEPGYNNGPAAEAKFYSPKGIDVTDEGGLLIADSMNNAIRYLLDGAVMTLAGSDTGAYGNVDGINGHHLFDYPTDVIADRGDVYVIDSFNNKLRQLSFYTLPSDLPINDEIKIVLGANVLQFDAKPEIVNKRTMVPLRAVSEALEFEVEYEKGDRTIVLRKNETTITLTIGREEMVTERAGESQKVEILDVAPYVREDRTYVPLRFFSEQFGLDVQWHAPNRTVILREKA